MNPLLSTAAIMGAELAVCASPDDPESHEHCQPAPVYYSRPLDLDVANDFRDTPREPGSRGRAVGVRPWDQIVGQTWHQTATAALDEDHPGLLLIPAHCLLHRSGAITLLHHPTAYVQHGHVLNPGTIGIEVVCRAAGTEGDERTFWRSTEEKTGWRTLKDGSRKWVGKKSYAQLVHEATPAQLEAIPRIMAYYCKLVARERKLAPDAQGARGQWGHCQGHESRTSDPGSRIYQAVDRARVELDMPPVHQLWLGSGRPVKVAWLAH